MAELAVTPDSDPWPAGHLPGRPRRQPRLVQGELAAREDGRSRPARLRPGAEQHLVQHLARRDPRHPRRAVGQAGLAGDRTDLRRLGRPARRCRLRPLLHRSRWARRPRSSCRAGSATPSRPWTTRRPTPIWSTTTGARRPRTPTPSSTWPTRRWRSTGRSRSSQAELSEADQAHPRLADVTPMAAKQMLDHRRERPAGPGAARRCARAAARSAAPTLDLGQPGVGQGFDFAPYGVVINAAAYTTVDAAETDGRAAGRPGPSTSVGVACSGRGSSGAPLHPGAHLLGLRLRRHGRAARPKTSRSPRSVSTARPRQPATHWSDRCRRTTCCAPAG